MMQAAVGDWLYTGGRNAGQRQHRGQIVEIHGTDGQPPYLVRFSDGRTTLVIPGPEAVIERSEPSSAKGGLPADNGGDSAPGLVFRVTGSQRRALVITAVVVSAVAAALAGASAAVANLDGRLAALMIGAGAAAIITLYCSVAYTVAYTKCTPEGLRVRGVAGWRYLPWTQVRDIAVRDYRTYRGKYEYRSYRSLWPAARQLRIVIVTTHDGRCVWLAAPIDGGQGLNDPKFDDKVSQIEDYWRSMG